VEVLEVVEVLYASNNNISISFMPILSTKYVTVEVVEIVKVVSLLKDRCYSKKTINVEYPSLTIKKKH
jgi:hypothetical protein